MGKKPSLEATITTRDRILSAAMLRFSKQSYDETGLRDIAADANVDVAYVHRCFGSKRQLFAEAVNRAVQADHIFEDIAQDLIEALTQRVLARDARITANDVDPLDITVRSLSCPEAVEVFHDFMLKDLIEPLADSLEAPAMQRAALVAAFLTGLSILRNVVGVETLREARGGELEVLIRSVLRTLISKNVAARRK